MSDHLAMDPIRSLTFGLRSPSLPASNGGRADVAASHVSLMASGQWARIGFETTFGLCASQNLPESLGNLVSLSKLEPSQHSETKHFFEQTAADQVYVPPQNPAAKPPLHPNGPILTGGFVGPIAGKVAAGKNGGANLAGKEEEPNRAHFRPAIRGQVSQGAGAIGLSGAAHSQTLNLSESSYSALLNDVTRLSETQRDLEEKVLDLGAHNLDLNGRIFEVKNKTAETIAAQEQLMGETFNKLVARMEMVEKRGAKLEAKREVMERKVRSVDEKIGEMEVELGGKKEKLEKVKKEVEKRGKILKCCGIGGLVAVVGAVYVLLK